MTVREVRRILIEELARGTPPAASRIADAAPTPVSRQRRPHTAADVRRMLLHLAQACPQGCTPATDHVAERRR
jgi:hypothetical protein